jgi:hypothetical protein
MHKNLNRLRLFLLTLTVMASLFGEKTPSSHSLAQSEALIYLPIISKSDPQQTLPRINAPHFSGQIPFEQTAIAWFGTLSPSSNHADMRVGYNNDHLFIYLAVFDRRLWYDENPQPQSLTQWDAVTLFIDTNSSPSSLSPSSWRFVAQLAGEANAQYRAVYRGSASGWQAASVPFEANPGWRGGALNDDRENDRGWAMGFTIPFSSLGWTALPPYGTTWRLGIVLHDRDSFAGPPLADQSWPAQLSPTVPGSWGMLNFGIPLYISPVTPRGSVTIRRPTQNDPSVPDADIGGVSANQCPGDEQYIWNTWPNRNYGHTADFNIQNQSDVADWPCFARYYVSFPLDAIPRGKTIISATLTLHQFGNAGGPGQAQPSWIQVLTAQTDWQEETITWNNAPEAYENIGGTWVDIIQSVNWPGVPRIWDVAYAVVKAYNAGSPLHLILYEADSAYHSGKYFVSSDTGDWNLEGRPRLDVVWGD